MTLINWGSSQGCDVTLAAIAGLSRGNEREMEISVICENQW